MPTIPGRHGGRKYGWPLLLSACNSSPDDWKVSTTAGPSVPAAREYAGGQPSATATMCANVRVPILQRVPVHAGSCLHSGNSEQIEPKRSTIDRGISAPFGIRQ